MEQLEGYEEDICSTWMAHHLARLMIEARHAAVGEREIAETHCREAILAVWRNRSHLNDPRPLDWIDRTLDAVRALREREGGWFFSKGFKADADGSEKAIALAHIVDKGARSILRYLIANSLADKAAKEAQWIRMGLGHLFANTANMQALSGLLEDAEALHGTMPMSAEQDAVRQEVRHNLLQFVHVAKEIAASL